MKNITSTEADLQEFKRQVLEWMNRLNLNDWDPKFIMTNTGDAQARCSSQPGSRKVLFMLGMKRQEIVPLAECAKHEALELLLADLASMMAGFFSDQYISDEVHKVINRLMIALPDLESKKEEVVKIFLDAYERNQGGLRNIISDINGERRE